MIYLIGSLIGAGAAVFALGVAVYIWMIGEDV